MIHFRQLFDPESSTYTYLLGDPLTAEAVLIDSVLEEVDRYLELIDALHLRLVWVLDTHVHADHVTAAGVLRERTGARTAVSRRGGADCADRGLDDGDTVVFGHQVIRVLATPGHTPGCLSYLWRDRVFTGDALLIGACGRTDFQGGDAGALYDSITGRLFVLPDETLVYPAHDYRGRRVSCIGEEKATNARLAGRSRDDFVALMGDLRLPRPRRIDVAVPANQACGEAAGRPVQGV